MLLVLSPSKTLDYESKLPISAHTQPEMLAESELLIKELRRYSQKKLAALMDISDKLAALNVQRFHDFSTPFTPGNARPALLAFKGDVYTPMGVGTYGKKEFAFAQEHVRILSGLYGLLKPLDLIQPYRLEMGTRLKNPRGKDLYAFWGGRITAALDKAMQGHKDKVLVNLASGEYSGAIRPEALKARLLNIVFKENQKGKLKIIGLFAKKARGMMADYVIKNQIVKPEGLKGFREGGYRFEPSLSADGEWVFTR